MSDVGRPINDHEQQVVTLYRKWALNENVWWHIERRSGIPPHRARSIIASSQSRRGDCHVDYRITGLSRRGLRRVDVVIGTERMHWYTARDEAGVIEYVNALAERMTGERVYSSKGDYLGDSAERNRT